MVHPDRTPPASAAGRKHSTAAELMVELEAGDRIRTDVF